MAEAQGDEAREAEVAGQEDVTASSVPALAGEDVVADTLTYLARALVQHPDEVKVERADGDRGRILRLRVHPDDMGRVIGRAGRIARAIRQVTRAAAARGGVSAFIEIGDDR